MDIVTLGAALNGSAEYVNSHFKGGSNIQIVDNPDGTQTINASGEVSSEDTVARADIAAIKDGETLDSFGDVETALGDKADTSTTYTKTEVDTALSAKANATDVYSKSDVDTVLSGKVDKETGKGLSTNDYTTAEKTKLAGIAEGAEVNEIEGIKVNNTSVNPDADKVVNITIPTTAADVSALPDTTKYAAALSLTINSSTYVMTGQLKDQNGDNLGTAQAIDLPLESVVVGGSYNSQTQKVVLTLQNGNTVEFSVADLVSGLQTELSASNKLNPAYINYDSTHRAVSDTEKSTWNGKQNALSSAQLAAVNSGITSEDVDQIGNNKNNILKDEAALVELVDSGAKNLLDLSGITPTVPAGITCVKDGEEWVVNGTLSTLASIRFFDIPNSIGDVKIILSGCPEGGSTTTYSLDVLGIAESKDYGEGSNVFSIVGDTFTLRCVFTAGTYSDIRIKPMLCTKAAWNISQTYQPYRPSYQELYEMVKALQANQ